jgi:hypothetical protein
MGLLMIITVVNMIILNIFMINTKNMNITSIIRMFTNTMISVINIINILLSISLSIMLTIIISIIIISSMLIISSVIILSMCDFYAG